MDTQQESCVIAKMTVQCALYMGAMKIFGPPGLRQRLLFPAFSWAFVSIDPTNVPTKFEVRRFTRSWDNRGRGGHTGSGMVPFERALVIFYRPSIVTFPLSLRVSEILPLLFSSTPRTDRRTTCDRKTALCTKVHCAVKMAITSQPV